MKELMINEAVLRIEQMEMFFDLLQKSFKTDPESIGKDCSLKNAYRILVQYYESGQWLSDYELDEKGLLPKTMKRGILSQDALYDFFDQINGEHE